MAKALKIVGTVVAVVAIVASAAATFGASLGLSAALVSAASTVASVASIAAAGIGIAAAAFAPKPGFSGAGNPLSFQTNPQSGLPYCIGRTRMSGLRIHGDTYDSPSWKSESKDDVLAFGVLLSAGGAIEEIESFRADKEVVSFDPSTGAAAGASAGWMAQKISLGLAGASALALSFGGVNFPGWTADHKLSGMAHALWDLRGDPKGDHYGAGVPEPEWIGKWVKVYDPRLDSTYPGGSGPHRALNESTYTWSANPALHALTWALGRWQNGKRTLGIGSPVENIRVADFVEAANVADANGWTCGGVEWSTDPKWSTLKRMLQAGGAEPTMTGAMIGCRVNMPRVPIAAVTADKLQDSGSFPMSRSRRDRFNTVIPRYRSEDHDWEVVSGSPVSVPLYIEEDRGQRTKEIDFPLVQHEATHDGNKQAGELAAYDIVNSREAGPWRFTVGPEYIGVKTGDVITLDVPDEGIDEQPVLVRKRLIDPASFKITFEVETETTAKHDFALGKTTVPPPSYTPTPPNLTPPIPDASLWSLAESATADGVPCIVVEGVCEFPGADSVLIEYRKAGDTAWINRGKFEASAPVKHVISPVDGAADYDARVAYQSGIRVGDWLNLTTVTTPAVTLGGVDIDLVIQQYMDYSEENDNNALPPPAATSVTVTGIKFNDASGAAIVSWDFTRSTDPAAANNIDGYRVGLMARTSPLGYPYNPADDNNIRWTNVTPDITSVAFPSVAVDLNCTAIVIPYRNVRTAVSAETIIYGPPAQSSSTTPYKQADAGNFKGEIDGASAVSVRVGSGKANVAIDDDNNISTGRVLTGSILEGAINEADWVVDPAGIGLGLNDIYGYNVCPVESTGNRMVIKFILPYRIEVLDPDPGDECYFTINLWAERQSNGADYYSDTFTVSDVWTASAATGLKYFGTRAVMIEATFDGLPAGPYKVGWVGETNSTCGVFIASPRYVNGDDKRAAS
jgi:hypothetical protein